MGSKDALIYKYVCVSALLCYNRYRLFRRKYLHCITFILGHLYRTLKVGCKVAIFSIKL